MDRVTFATSSGFVWFALSAHFAAGLTAIATGAIALAAAKGSPRHRQAGTLFSGAMVALGLTAMGIGAYEQRPGQVVAGLFAAYLVFTAMTTVKPLLGFWRRLDAALMVVAFACAAAMLYGGINEWLDPTVEVGGRPRIGPPLIGGTVLLLAALGDLGALRAGGLQGRRRLARHLWRMCFGLFIATGSFFLGQMKFIPEPVRLLPLLLALAFLPLLFLLYWSWRVRWDPALVKRLLHAPGRSPP